MTMTKKQLFASIILIICINILFLFVVFRAGSVPYVNDEMSWFFHIKFYEELFYKHDIRSSYWVSYESFDHPQVSKYLFGAYLHLRYSDVFSSRDALESLYGRWAIYSDPRLLDVSKTPFAPFIAVMREINVLFTYGTLCLLLVLLTVVTGHITAGIIFVFMLASSNLFMNTMIRATSDAHVTFFIIAAFTSLLIYSVTKKHRSKMVLFVLFSICTGLAISSKLTGAFLIIFYIYYEILQYGLYRDTIGKSLRRACVFLGIVWIIWYGTNPALYFSPISNSIQYVTFRNTQSAKLQHFFSDIAITSYQDKWRAIGCTFFKSSCPNTYENGRLFPWILLNVVSVFWGVVVLMRSVQIRAKGQINLLLLSFSFVVVIVTGTYLPINSDRYYLMPMLAFWIIQFVAVSDTFISLYRYVLPPRIHIKTPSR